MTINSSEEIVFRPVSNAAPKLPEQKPNYNNRYLTPQDELRRTGMSPNMTEGKERPGLKDLARLAAEQNESNVVYVSRNANKTGKQAKQESGTKSSTNKPQSPVDKAPKSNNNDTKTNDKTEKKGRKNKRNKRSKKNNASPTPVTSSVKITPVRASDTTSHKTSSASDSTSVATSKVNNSPKKPASTPVTPEVEYQEKSIEIIHPSHNSISLSKPVKDTDKYASKDNSVDGFLSIKR